MLGRGRGRSAREQVPICCSVDWLCRDYIKANLRIQVACGSADTAHIKTVRAYHAALTAAEVPHRYFEVEGVAHNKKKLCESRKETWFDFHVESLKLNGVELHYVKGVP